MLLSARGLHVTFRRGGADVPVLHGIDLDLAAGETLGVVGESGSGKSTLALAIMRLLPDGARIAGALRLENLDLLAADEAALCRYRGAQVGIVFQEPMTALDPLRRVASQVAEPLRLHRRLPRAAALGRARALLTALGVARPEAWPHQLSGGQRQRVLIASALACDPVLLIADEPTTALDVTTQAQVLDLIAAEVVRRRMALLLVSHDLAVVTRAVSRVLVLYAGRVVEDGPADLLQHPAHPYTRALLAASPHGLAPPRPIPGAAPPADALPPGCAFAPRCARADAQCRLSVPPLAGAAVHRVACWHPQ